MCEEADVQDVHIHQLLELIDQPAPTPTSAQISEQQQHQQGQGHDQEQQGETISSQQPDVSNPTFGETSSIPATADASAEHTAEHVEQPTEIVQPEVKQDQADISTKRAGLNFLQADELQVKVAPVSTPATSVAPESAQPAQAQAQGQGRERGISEAREAGYEVIPSMPAHEVS